MYELLIVVNFIALGMFCLVCALLPTIGLMILTDREEFMYKSWFAFSVFFFLFISLNSYYYG